MRFRYGKYVKINRNHPQAVGICDSSGFVFNHRDLVKQMSWRGDDLEWTGLLVGKPFLDEPNQQSRPPIIGPDPLPIQNPRPPQGQIITWDSNPYIWGVAGIDWDEFDDFDQGIIPLPREVTLQQLSNVNWSTAG